jgi:DtxR family Mn-dependent transcriptional regulator
VTLNREDYLLVVWEFLESFDSVSEIDISRRLKISPPTAHEYIQKIMDDGMVRKIGKKIDFTPAGRKAAIPLVRTHRISEVFAYNMLEVPWEETHSSVMELEHIFKDERVETLFRKLGSPLTCPHGNPTNPDQRMGDIPSSLVNEGTYRVQRISFEDRDLLKTLASVSILPGDTVSVFRDDNIVIQGPNGEIKLTPYNAQALRLARIT